MEGMDRSAELRLPTVAVPVRVAILGQTPIAAELFVPETSQQARAQLLEDVSMVVEKDEGFLPVRGPEGVRLFAKHAVVWIAIRREVEHDVDEELDMPEEVVTLYDRHHRVELQLVTGATLVGMLFDSSPADRPRVVDHLNRAKRFLRLWTADEHYLVNTQQILQVTELAWSLE
ncbi:MAG: hypothetical protein JWO36_6583 [Myxococcales bacterium]|nr:hypothetical protein [Myxococcales bacterium]